MMKTNFKISFLSGFLFAGSVFAQVFLPGGFYPNIGGTPAPTPVVEKPVICIGTFSSKTTVNGYDVDPGNVWISQDKAFCDDVENDANNSLTPFYMPKYSSYSMSGSKEMNSLSESAEVLGELLNDYWIPDPILALPSDKSRQTLVFLSDFDFGQIDLSSNDKSCIKNHTPLPFRSGAGRVNGADYVARNLCYEGAAKDMEGPLGLFGEVEKGSIQHLNIANVNFKITVSKEEKVKIRPVGAMAGRTIESLFSTDSIADVTIDAPYAGAFIGLILNSTVKGLRADDDIFVFNTSNVGPDATFEKLDWIPEHRVLLGGVTAIASDATIESVKMVAKIQDSSDVKNSVLGGVAGLGIIGQFKDASDEKIVVSGIDFYMKKETTYTKIKGGKYMGGFYGHVVPFENAYNAKNVMTLLIDGSHFYGSVFKSSTEDVVYVGGMVGYSGLDEDCLLNISNSQVEVNIKDTVGEDILNYYAGGFVGFGSDKLGTGKNDSHLKINGSKASGEIKIVDDFGDGNDDFAIGGFVGKGVFTSVGAALESDTSSVNIVTNIAGGASVTPNASVGGFVGNISKVSQNKKLEMNTLVSSGKVSATASLNNVYMGGIIGVSSDKTEGVSVTLKNLEVYNNSIAVLKAGQAPVAAGKAYVGGVCGLCNSVETLYHAAVKGNIIADGNYQVDSLLVGGWFGSVNVSSGFSYSVNYFIGDVLGAKSSNTNGGFFFGKGFIDNKKIDSELKSNYHYGNEKEMDFFGSLLVVNNKDIVEMNTSWKEQGNKDLKLDFSFNVSNGDEANIYDASNSGLQTENFMKLGDLEKFLDNGKKPKEKEWAWKEGFNGDLPYFKGYENSASMNFIPAPAVPTSSSSEVEESSSSEEEESSSSEVEESSSSEEEESSSSEVEESSSSEVEESSSSEEPVVSSSEEPVVSSSSEIDSSSSSEFEPESSSENVVVSVKAPKFEDISFKQSGNAVKAFIKVKVPSVEFKTVAKLDILGENGSILKTVIITDSVEASNTELTKVIAPVPYGKFSVKITLDNGYFENYDIKELDVDNKVQVGAWSWQMVSFAGYDYSSLSNDNSASFFWWDETTEFGEYWQYHAYTGADVNVKTSGIWYGSLDARTVTLKSDINAEVTDIVWNVDSVFSGWNLVCNPYGWTIDVSSLDKADVKIWNWNPESSSYGIPKVLHPYEAMWVKTSRPMTLVVPADPVFDVDANAVMAKKSAFAKVEGGWSLRVKLSDHFGKSDSWNVIGAGRSESSEEPPSGMGDHVSFSIVNGKKALAKSIMPEKDEMEWTAELSASDNRLGVLELEGISDVNACGKKVFVTIDGRTTEMKEGIPLEVKLSDSPKLAVIRVAADARPIVDYALRGFSANRSGNMLDVNFEASSGLNGSRLNVQLVSVLGEVIASVKTKTVSGMNQVSLKVPQNGLYVVRIQAGKQVMVNNVYVR